MPIYTTIDTYPLDQLNDVLNYSENHELVRQVLIKNVWMGQEETHLNNIFAELDANFKRVAIAIAQTKSDAYDGGLWEFNEHGLLSLITSQDKLDCTCSNHGIEVTPEEFSFAMSIFAANLILSDENAPQYAQNYFRYIYHLAHCILTNAKNTDTFDISNVNSIID